jgi:hypothetical protein
MNVSPPVVIIKRVFPEKGLRKWQSVCSWISWFRILPGKGEHQATN